MTHPPRALVTGASGFIGTRLVGQLVDAGVEVVAVDILPPRVERPMATYVTHDVRNPIPAELGAGVDVIYNFAAVHRTPGHPVHEYYDTNVKGALNVCALAETVGVDRIVFTSSISVYGPSEALMVETSQLQPESAYGRSKQMAELIHGQWLARGADRKLVVVRPGVVFGPGERGNYTNLAKALKGGYFVYPGRRDTIKSGGYVDELISAIGFALDHPSSQILFNFAYPEVSTTEQIVATFGRVAGLGGAKATVPTAAMLALASVFEVANAAGLKNPIHRERIIKLVRSTRISPAWLTANGYKFGTNLESALAAWRDETNGTFA